LAFRASHLARADDATLQCRRPQKPAKAGVLPADISCVRNFRNFSDFGAFVEHTKHQRFFAANLELRGFLRRAEALASRSDTLKEEELEAIWPVLVDLTPEAEDAYSCEMLDGELQHEIAEYVKSLRSLQQAIETIRCVMLAPRRGTGTDKKYSRRP
jgi:hypothetical protein